MTRDARPVFPDNCSWCGHDPHTGVCPGHIQTGTSKTPREVPCPCKKRDA